GKWFRRPHESRSPGRQKQRDKVVFAEKRPRKAEYIDQSSQDPDYQQGQGRFVQRRPDLVAVLGFARFTGGSRSDWIRVRREIRPTGRTMDARARRFLRHLAGTGTLGAFDR